MSDYVFSDAQRWGVFSVQGDSCYICRRPLDLRSMEIDHILPESLLKYPEILQNHLRALGLPTDFQINSFSNWLPICGACNKSKGDRVFSPSLLIQQQLEKTNRNSAKAALAAEDILNERKAARALNSLMRGLEDGVVDQEFMMPLVLKYMQLHPEALESVRKAVRRTGAVLGLQLAPPELRLSQTRKIMFVPGGLMLVDEAEPNHNVSWRM